MTKRDLTRDDLQTVLRCAFGEDGEIAETQEFTDGWFAAVHGVRLVNGQEVVVKASPPADLPMLRYEVDLPHIEREFYRLAGAAGVPVPAVRYSDADGGYLITDWLRGTSLRILAPGMAPESLKALRKDIAAMLARLHSVTSPWFGYLRRDGHTHASTWRESFLIMIEDIVADAIDLRQELPAPAATIEKVIRRNADVLDEVTVPALIHYDLWDGNIFVRPMNGGHVVEGVIDGERAFFGDPIADFVVLNGLEDERYAASIMEGYWGEARQWTESERARLRLYTMYLDIIMLTEGAVRQFDPAEHDDILRWATGRLAANLAELS